MRLFIPILQYVTTHGIEARSISLNEHYDGHVTHRHPRRRFQRHHDCGETCPPKSGLVVPDDTDMGLRIQDDHTAIAADGSRSERLLPLIPLLRGSLWETILGQRTESPMATPVMMEYII